MNIYGPWKQGYVSISTFTCTYARACQVWEFFVFFFGNFECFTCKNVHACKENEMSDRRISYIYGNTYARIHACNYMLRLWHFSVAQIQKFATG